MSDAAQLPYYLVLLEHVAALYAHVLQWQKPPHI